MSDWGKGNQFLFGIVLSSMNNWLESLRGGWGGGRTNLETMRAQVIYGRSP